MILVSGPFNCAVLWRFLFKSESDGDGADEGRVELFLDVGAQLFINIRNGKTSLHAALEKASSIVVRMLV